MADQGDDLVPPYVSDRVRATPPAECSIVPGSTPVISFGNARIAGTATLGLNPSKNEFIDPSGWLTGSRRRLETLDHLGISDLTEASEEMVTAVVGGCNDYFQRNPFRRWFNPLDRMLQGIGSSYYDGSACHLDLVQWATDPVWQHLSPRVRRRLVDADVAFLGRQLDDEQIGVLLLNGRTVIDNVRAMGAELTEVEPAIHQQRRSGIVAGWRQGVAVVGWSMNLQTNRVGPAFGAVIAARVRDALDGLRAGPGTDDDGSLPRGRAVRSWSELRDLLSDWAAASAATTIGDVSAYGRRPWLFVDLGDERVVLNADTTRAAVLAFLAFGDARGWKVVANRRDPVNRVVYRTDADLPGWYAYLSRPRSQSGPL